MVQIGMTSKQKQPVNNRDEMQSLSRRIKMIEERYTTLRSKAQLTEQNMVSKNKTIFVEIKSINLEMMELKKEIVELKDKILSLIKELDSFAKKEKVDVLKKYIDLWSPSKFVTRKEVEDIVQEAIDKKE